MAMYEDGTYALHLPSVLSERKEKKSDYFEQYVRRSQPVLGIDALWGLPYSLWCFSISFMIWCSSMCST